MQKIIVLVFTFEDKYNIIKFEEPKEVSRGKLQRFFAGKIAAKGCKKVLRFFKIKKDS